MGLMKRMWVKAAWLLVAGWLADRLGRKTLILYNNFFFILVRQRFSSFPPLFESHPDDLLSIPPRDLS